METDPEKRLAEIILRGEIIFAKGGIKCPPELHISMFNPFAFAIGEVEQSEGLHFPASMLLTECRLEILEWALSALDLWDGEEIMKYHVDMDSRPKLNIKRSDRPKEDEDFEVDDWGRKQRIKAIDKYLLEREKEFFPFE